MFKQILHYVVVYLAGIVIFVNVFSFEFENVALATMHMVVCFSGGIGLGYLVVESSRNPGRSTFLVVCAALGAWFGSGDDMAVVTTLGGLAVGKVLILLSNPSGVPDAT